jgi:hypothetical protein
MSVLVWSVFRDGRSARKAVEALIESSFPPDEIKVLMKSRDGITDVPMERKTAVPAGVAAGATLGAVGATGAILLTGGGALIAAGPIAGLLQAAGMGAALGSIAGAMAGIGWWKDEPDVPDAADEQADARVLVLIPVPDGREQEARGILREAGAERVDATSAGAALRAHGSEALADELVEQQADQEQRESGRDRNPE